MSGTTNAPPKPRTRKSPKAKGGPNWWDREPDVCPVAPATPEDSIPWWERNSYMNLAQRQAAAASVSSETTPTVVASPLGPPAPAKANPPGSPVPSKARTAPKPRTPKAPKAKGPNWWDREPEADPEVIVSSVATTAAITANASVEPASPSPSPKAARRAPGSVMAACAAAAVSAYSPGMDKPSLQPASPPRGAQVAERAKAPKSPASPASPGRTSARTTRTTSTKPTSPAQSKGKGKGKGKDKWWMADPEPSEPAQPEETGINWWDLPCLLNEGKLSGTSSGTSSTTTSSTSTASGKGDSCPSTPPQVVSLSIKGAAARALGDRLGALAHADGASQSAGAGNKVVRKKTSWEDEEREAKAFAGVDWSELE